MAQLRAVRDHDPRACHDEIDALRAENDSLKSAYEIMRNVADERKAENERLRSALTDAAAEWHAPSCDVDAGGGCILHAEEKEAWIAAKIGR